ncbi:MAG: tellurite resistance TerB family protein [Halioglobus sp.]
MNMSSLLNQLLESAAGQAPTGSPGGNSDSAAGGSVSDFISGRGGAALAGGALGLLLGTKKGRKMGGKALKYGGVAALGVMAYKAYGNWQAQGGQMAPTAEPQTLDRVTGPVAEQHSTAVLKAIIAAAKSDGHVDERERQLIDEGMRSLTAEASVLQWVDRELQKPLDPVEVASAADSIEVASEMYLASALVIDEGNFMERSYLEELGRQLKLAPELVTELNAQAAAAQAAA